MINKSVRRYCDTNNMEKIIDFTNFQILHIQVSALFWYTFLFHKNVYFERKNQFDPEKEGFDGQMYLVKYRF